jgi:hypothetical protein
MRMRPRHRGAIFGGEGLVATVADLGLRPGGDSIALRALAEVAVTQDESHTGR